jgi:hypothetical protein
MKTYIVHMFAATVGTEACELLEMWDDHTQEELDSIVWEMALDHAESYGYYPMEDAPDVFEDEEDEEQYTHNIEGWAELYDPEKHDGLI